MRSYCGVWPCIAWGAFCQAYTAHQNLQDDGPPEAAAAAEQKSTTIRRFIILRALFQAGMHRLCAFTVSFLSGGVTSRRRVRGLVGSEGGGAAIRSMKDVRRCSKSCGRLSTSWGHQRSELVSAHLRHLARRSCWAFSREGWQPADLGSLAACRQTDSGRALATSPGPLWLYVVLGKETEFQKAEPT